MLMSELWRHRGRRYVRAVLQELAVSLFHVGVAIMGCPATWLQVYPEGMARPARPADRPGAPEPVRPLTEGERAAWQQLTNQLRQRPRRDDDQSHR